MFLLNKLFLTFLQCCAMLIPQMIKLPAWPQPAPTTLEFHRNAQMGAVIRAIANPPSEAELEAEESNLIKHFGAYFGLDVEEDDDDDDDDD